MEYYLEFYSRMCVVQHLWYFPTLASWACPLWMSWGSNVRCTHILYCWIQLSLPPIFYLFCLDMIPLLVNCFKCTTRVYYSALGSLTPAALYRRACIARILRSLDPWTSVWIYYSLKFSNIAYWVILRPSMTGEFTLINSFPPAFWFHWDIYHILGVFCFILRGHCLSDAPPHFLSNKSINYWFCYFTTSSNRGLY